MTNTLICHPCFVKSYGNMSTFVLYFLRDNILKEMILYDARLNQKKVYISTPDKLVEIQQKLKGKVFERNFSQFYTKIEVIKSHKNVEVM